MKLLKIFSFFVFVFSILFFSGQAFASSSFNMNTNGGCFMNGSVDLDKTSYTAGETITATATINGSGCVPPSYISSQGVSASMGVPPNGSNSQIIVQNVGTGQTTFTAPSQGGSYTIWFLAAYSSNTGTGSSQLIGVGYAVGINPPQSVSIGANNNAINLGSPVTLSWVSTPLVNYCSLYANGVYLGAAGHATNSPGAVYTHYPTATTTYSISCTVIGGGPNVNDNTIVNVSNPPPTVTLTATSPVAPNKMGVTLAWQAQHATSCMYNNVQYPPEGNVNFDSTPLLDTTTFSVTCIGSGGSTTATKQIDVSTGQLNVATGPNNCNIILNGNSCYIPFSWSTANPDVTDVSEVYRNNNLINTNNLGNYVSVTIPYTGPVTGAVVRLKNNNVQLNPSSATVDTEETVYADCILGTSWDSVGNKCSALGSAPVVNNPTSSSITTSSATINATLVSEGNPTPVTERGFCYSQTNHNPIYPNPANATCTTTTGTGLGNFSKNLTLLSPGALYYFTGYAKNSFGSSSTSVGTFTTLTALPVVVNPTSTAIADTSATLGSTVNSAGSSAITTRGVCYGSSANPKVAGDPNPGTSGTCVSTTGTTGTFTILTGAVLAPNTTYNYRGYARNSSGYAYSPNAVFATTTSANAVPSVINPTATSITGTSAVLGANVLSLGRPAAISARGVCYSSVSTIPPSLTTGSTTCKVASGTTTGIFTVPSNVLVPGTVYYYRGYATNTTGTGYSPVANFTAGAPSGSINATGCTIPSGASTCNASVTWTTQNLTLNPTAVTRNNPDNTLVSTATSGTNVSNTVNFGPSTYYLYHQNVPLAEDSIDVPCAVGSTWNGSICYSSSNVIPTVTSPTATLITKTSANLGANVTSLGIPAVLSARGTCYGNSPSTTTNCLDQGGRSLGAYSHLRSGLTPNTKYYYRGYATNATGTGFSVIGSFTTLSDLEPSGTITASDCTILLGNSSCLSTINWNVTNPALGADTAVTTPTNITVGTGLSGTKTYSVDFGNRDFFLYHDSRELGNARANAICDPATSVWDNSSKICAPKNPQSSGTITASDCTILLGNSSCLSTINWNVTNPALGADTAVTTPTNITVGTGLSGTKTYSVDFGNRDFFLYHDSRELGADRAVASCGALDWDPVEKKCVTGGGPYTVTASAGTGGTINPSSRSVASGATTTFTVTPNSGYTASIEGTCPYGSFSGNNYTTGPINSNCNVIAVFNSGGGGGAINIDFRASPKRIFKGRSSNLIWKAEGATSCTGTNFDTGNQREGTLSVKPTSTTLYTLTCKDAADNTAVDTAEVKVSVIKFFEI